LEGLFDSASFKEDKHTAANTPSKEKEKNEKETNCSKTTVKRRKKTKINQVKRATQLLSKFDLKPLLKKTHEHKNAKNGTC
jgi:hypothetical protein